MYVELRSLVLSIIGILMAVRVSKVVYVDICVRLL